MSDSATGLSSGDKGWLIGALSLIGNVVAVTVGVPASVVVASQCIGGRTFGKYLVFNGPVQLKDRYDGMKGAFGADRELFVPERRGGVIAQGLTQENYCKLVESVDRKFREFEEHQDARQNDWLREHSMFPQLEMGLGDFGYFVTLLYACFALLPLPLLALTWWLVDGSWKPQAAYGLLFMLVSGYDGTLLDVQRSVCYLKVPKCSGGLGNSVFDTLWARLHDRSVKGTPDSALAAVEDLKTGIVRQGEDNNELLIPVMALNPVVEFNTAMILSAVTHLRGPVLSLGFLFAAHPSPYMLASFCVAAFVQASLQNMSATYFQWKATPFDVFWFRRLPGPEDMRYPEHREYRKSLR